MKSRHSATSLSAAPADDRSSRMLKYTVMMGIRFLCIGAIPFVHGWWMLLPITGAVFMPYFAVVIANVSGLGKRAEAEPPVALSLESGTIPPAESPTLIVVDEPFISDVAPPRPLRPAPHQSTATRDDGNTQ